MGVVRKVLVKKAAYVPEVDAILLQGECEGIPIRHQIPSSCFTFGDKDVRTEMEKTADLMIGKRINFETDESLEDDFFANGKGSKLDEEMAEFADSMKEKDFMKWIDTLIQSDREK